MITIRGVAEAQEYLRKHDLDGWLIYDFQGSNPIFAEVMGETKHNTRPCFLLVPAQGQPVVLVHFVDAGKYEGSGPEVRVFISREDRLRELGTLLHGRARLAMEYSPQADLPVTSRVDAGTIELVRSYGAAIVPSADLLQFALYRLDTAQLASHSFASQKLTMVAQEAFDYIAAQLDAGVGEYEVHELMRRRYAELGLYAEDGPAVAVNEHCSFPHYEPTAETSRPIRPGDWVLIDFWAKEATESGMYADMTWVGYAGDAVPDEYRRVWEVVAGGRDRAVEFLAEAAKRGETVAGWQVDRAARDYIAAAGYGRYFTHRLGHSIGPEVHASGVNMDDFETKDTRAVMPGVLFTIEPGVYLERFGVRTEIDVYMTPDGPVVTTPVQREPALLRR